ncbi:hypothetical protein DF186_20995, partial [Enterococcus hirae]
NLLGNGITVDFEAILGGAAGAAALIVVPAVEYQVTANGLSRNGSLLAADVEDMQIAYLFDFDDDNVLDAGEERGITGDDYDS